MNVLNFEFDSSVLSAILVFAGVIITGIITLFTFKKELLNKRVTAERIEWLNTVRKDYSLIMAVYEYKKISNNNYSENGINKEEYDKRIHEALVAKYDLLSRLNTSTVEDNEYNFPLKLLLNKIDFYKIDNILSNKDLDRFKFYMNLMLESVWSKCKEESR